MDWCARLGLRDVDIPLDGAHVRAHVGGSGPPLVLLHGNPTHGYLWRTVLPDLLGSFECHVLDLPGFGASSTTTPRGVSEHAHAVALTVDHLLDSERNVWWLGHDWGCATALHATRLLPRRRHAVALTEGHLRWLPPWQDLDPGFAGLFRSLREDTFGHDFVISRNAFVDDVLLGSLPHLSAGEREVYRSPFVDPPRRAAVLALARQVPVDGDPPSMAPVLDAVATALADPQTPKLLMTATPGAVVDEAAVRWVHQHAASSSTVDIGAGEHFTPEQQPQAIAAAVSSWAARVGRATD